MIADDDEGFPDITPHSDLVPDSPDAPAPTQAQISLHTLLGHLDLETLHLLGHITDQQVVILSDRGNTHNFVQEHLVHSLSLPTRATTPLRVMVGNGHQLHCHLLCETVTVRVQDVVFFVDHHMLPLCGVNLMLGMQWLKTLGPLLTDYNDLTMKFIYGEQLIELKGDTESTLHLITPPQLHRLVQRDGASEFFHLRIISTELPSSQTHSIPLIPKIQLLTTKFAALF